MFFVSPFFHVSSFFKTLDPPLPAAIQNDWSCEQRIARKKHVYFRPKLHFDSNRLVYKLGENFLVQKCFFFPNSLKQAYSFIIYLLTFNEKTMFMFILLVSCEIQTTRACALTLLLLLQGSTFQSTCQCVSTARTGQTLSNLMCSKYINQSKRVNRFWLVNMYMYM